jgi:hypothetical protein
MSKKYRRSIIILADGSRADVFQKLLKEGSLPQIQKNLPHFRQGVSVFPSTTGPAYMPYLTGCYPGTCDVPGIRWFDKNAYTWRPFVKDKFRSYVGLETFQINNDMSKKVRTLFEIIPRAASVFNSVSRGAKFKFNATWFSRIWYWYYAHLTDHWLMIDKEAANKTINELNLDVNFLFVVFPGIDEHSHLSSPFRKETYASYGDLDDGVGKIVNHLKRKGQWEETAIFIVSDHGLSETKSHLPLNQFLKGLGIDTFYYPRIVFRYGFKAASMVSGNGMSHLYFKGEKGWKGRMSWEVIQNRNDRLLDQLLERPEIDIIAGQSDDGSVVVKSRRGEARIFGNPFKYKVVTKDPFGYPPLPAQMTERESLDLTASTDYPDSLVQLLQIFLSGRTGDLIISAAKGFDLRKRHEVPEHKSSHGSLHWEHMNIPIVTNLPLQERPIRSVDIFPTILEAMDLPKPPLCDGISMI